MTRIALVTAIFDGYDTLKELPSQSVDVDAVCVTDDPELRSDTWRILYRPAPGMHPNRAAKVPKLCPWRFINAHASVWVDASFRVISPTFVEEALMLARPFAAFRHPTRDCIYDEAEASTSPKYDGEPIAEQIKGYREDGHPEHWGLWAGGVLARTHTSDVHELSRAWLEECLVWSFQDQLSLPPLLRDYDMLPVDLGDYFDWNGWLEYEGSERHT